MQSPQDDGDGCDDENVQLFTSCTIPAQLSCARDLLVVFDMDHTMVGDLVSLSDRDNVETNMPWTW